MTRPTDYAVMVIAARCGHPVDVQLTDDAKWNLMRTQRTLRTDCMACTLAEIAANTARLREKHPELFTRGSRIKGWRDKKWNGS